ncbi:amidohydrolase [Cellulomonas telluris]|uniref:amidohydrolase n=1 Tax=Cellulomonas telluris TaxID=2306636 RepID=UPI0010A7E547|nr:amidohydrolase [Cellulomonas telluris]
MSTDAARRYLADVVTNAVARRARPTEPRHDGAPAHVRAAVTATVEDVLDDLVGLADRLHARPETAFAEHASVAAACDVLARHGVTATVGAHGLATAFRAEVGTGGPTVALLAEYDALPGLGHACGHNLICAAAVGAFLAAAARTSDVGGTVVLLGTPGEEGGGGKELLARAGAFDGVDAVLMVHPSGVDLSRHVWAGARSAAVRYRGVAAHAAATPFLGRNALDAVVLAYQGLAQLRQHVLPDDRVHLVITDGGETPGVVPADTRARVGIRSGSVDGLRELSGRVEAVLRAAADATGTEVEVTWDERPAYLPMRNNVPLADRFALHLEAQGRVLLEPGALPSGLAASTDLGNVSVRVPAIQPLVATSPPHVTVHTAEFARWTTGERAAAAVRDSAAALALTAVDVLADPDLLADVRAAFAAQGGPSRADELLDGGAPA